MASYPVEVRRCQHIKTNGTQCGSPALREQPFCHFHQECRPEQVWVYVSDYHPPAEFHLPVLQDAASIRLALTQVIGLLLNDKIKPDIASLVLYALQIASSNLKRLKEEKPKHPTSVVVDRQERFRRAKKRLAQKSAVQTRRPLLAAKEKP